MMQAMRDKACAKGKGPRAKSKMEKTMGEFKEGELHSGSKKGPLVTDRSQALAIGLSQARKAARGKK
jgi:hypothetical protein